MKEGRDPQAMHMGVPQESNHCSTAAQDVSFKRNYVRDTA